MSLKPAAVDAFFADEDTEVPEGVPRHKGNSRPKIRHADDPTKMSYWPRASSFAHGVESTFLLDRHGERLVARGMAISPDLCDLAASLAGTEERGDKDELTRVAGLAKTAAGGDRKANRGTALHKYRERLDAGEKLAFLGPQMYEALQAYIRLMEPFEIHGSEQFVVNDRWRVAGSYDALLGLKPGYELVAPDGEVFEGDARLGADLKSGAHIDELGRVERAVQQAIYFCGGRPYVHVSDDDVQIGADGRGNWPDQIAPSSTWSLIPHVPLEHPEDAALWWVDLTKAAAVADQVAKLHELRKTEGLILPAEAPRRAIPLGPSLLAQIQAAPSEAVLDQLWQATASQWQLAHGEAARVRVAELSSGSTEVRTS